jgi:hypothetical protein
MGEQNEQEAMEAVQKKFDFRRAESEKYSRCLGQLISGFQMLELFIRVRLQDMPDARPMGITAYQDMFAYPEGTELPVTEMTSFDALGKVITRYNKEARKWSYPELDPFLVELRDAIAHGKFGWDEKTNRVRLIKFSEHRNGKVTVVLNVEISEEWCEEQRERITKATAELTKHRHWT